jgi:tellurium resistance protein TerD
VTDAFIQIVNMDNNIEIARFDLSEDYSTETATMFGDIYRYNGEWKFRAVGQGFTGGLEAICNKYGVNVV